MAEKIRINQLKKGDIFKRSEGCLGTVTYKSMGNFRQSRSYKNEYLLDVIIIAATKNITNHFTNKIGMPHILTTIRKYNRVGLVTKIA